MKQFGLIAYMLFVGSVAYMLFRWSGESTKTFSQNAARNQSSIIYYGIVLAVFLAMLSIFAYGWLIPTLLLPTTFSVVFGVGVAAEAIAGLVPETTGWRKVTHITVSGVMYVATLIIVGMLYINSSTPHVAKLTSAAAFIVMVAVILAVVLFRQLQRYALLLQTIHLFCFFGALLVVTYSVG